MHATLAAALSMLYVLPVLTASFSLVLDLIWRCFVQQQAVA